MDKKKLIFLIILISIILVLFFTYKNFFVSKNIIQEDKIYYSESLCLEFKYPFGSEIINKELPVEIILPKKEGSRVLERKMTISVLEDKEYDQSIEYYCEQGKPHTIIKDINGLIFCESSGGEESKYNSLGELVYIQRIAYHLIHNKKWFTLGFSFTSCASENNGKECYSLKELNIEEEEEYIKEIISSLNFTD